MTNFFGICNVDTVFQIIKNQSMYCKAMKYHKSTKVKKSFNYLQHLFVTFYLPIILLSFKLTCIQTSYYKSNQPVLYPLNILILMFMRTFEMLN